ncbi:precorrin-3B C17-methyltransferase [Natranaerovirga pectinivora]|uniref:Precorrin-3B C17-methyltransferase n=1 Tax=Natranaerovirga pectinivora TaxID=682400 RepID=A0A4R3MMN3_9FIRM|nr:precorrin-3B C(17)-methyltransferase [Natranaerovirga pectinivora]TCT13793.1 precorrin-3B C17-methyltransferase [Natranaerovirga pectinivora]
MKGKIYAIGLGPGDLQGMSLKAKETIIDCDGIVGYRVYVQQIKTLISEKDIYENGMGQEINRCEKAIEWAQEGKKVAMVCSGDSGVYGMAGLLYELLNKNNLLAKIPLEIIPGVTSAMACGSLLGAPIVEDFCTISLSDYMTPYETIEKRIEYAAKGDFTIAIYNPRSSKRPEYLRKAVDILLAIRSESTPVGIVRQAYREEQKIIRTTLGKIPFEEVDMFSTVIIGNSKTKWLGDYMVTSRGYAL